MTYRDPGRQRVSDHRRHRPIVIMEPMTNPYRASGSIWRLHHDGQEIARLTVTDTEMFWVHADVETLPGFEPFRQIFAEQECAAEDEDGELYDSYYEKIRDALTMTFPDGIPVAEFWLNGHGDGTASWRWHDEPFGTTTSGAGQ